MNSLAKNQIDRFLELIQKGIDAWTEAAVIARENLAQDPEWADKVAEKNRLITAQFVHRFACIGVKMIPQLAVSECPGAKKLRQLPISLQERCWQNPVGLLINNNGDWEELNVDLHNLTTDQAAQVFAEDHIRTAAEQRAWIEDKRAKQSVPPAKSNQPYRVVGSKLVVMVPCQFSRKELAQILADIE
jgi:hypothetical protein